MAQPRDMGVLFNPPRSRGLGLHISALLLVSVIVITLFAVALLQPSGAVGIGLLIAASLISLVLPLLFYRLYGLIKSGYWVSRDGLRLRWGLRAVDLPHASILDVARWADLEALPSLPRWGWPGALVGQVQDKELGNVEFLASDRTKLVLLGTAERVFVVSPEDERQFVAALKRESLRGSLQPLRQRSASPSFVLVEAWAQQLPRRLMAGGAVLAFALLLLAGFLAPSLSQVSLGFGADSAPLPPVAASQLLLLPALNLFFYVGNLMLGMLFFREPNGASLSMLMWGSSLVSSLLFAGAVVVSIL